MLSELRFQPNINSEELFQALTAQLNVIWKLPTLSSALRRPGRVEARQPQHHQNQPFWLIGMSWIFLWVAQIWQHVQNMRGRTGLQ